MLFVLLIQSYVEGLPPFHQALQKNLHAANCKLLQR